MFWDFPKFRLGYDCLLHGNLADILFLFFLKFSFIYFWIQLLVDIEKSYTPFFNLHQAEEVHELVLENYIRTSQNFAELSEKLLQVYEAVKQIFEIPSDEELRRIEPTEATLKKEQMRDQQNVFNSIYPKINLRMEEGAGGELRPTINEPQLNGMEEEPRPMEAGPIERRKWSWKQTRAPSIPEELLRCISRC
ncbi:hypothetical protein B9Z55_021866 [Caenorhabditis nigoni]|uniref:Uncharacterized protein n=1 Tax=Caenorhabditis nigoni TaxID=1611254 RepID=A0A2G5TUW0_9PELO|nr:hypothetical protein B9Z55_021866 [Caenorhabditis nigoni]